MQDGDTTVRVDFITTFSASRKETGWQCFSNASTLRSWRRVSVNDRIRFFVSDAPLPGFVSSVDRVLKRYPQMAASSRRRLRCLAVCRPPDRQ